MTAEAIHFVCYIHWTMTKLDRTNLYGYVNAIFVTYYVLKQELNSLTFSKPRLPWWSSDSLANKKQWQDSKNSVCYLCGTVHDSFESFPRKSSKMDTYQKSYYIFKCLKSLPSHYYRLMSPVVKYYLSWSTSSSSVS